MIVFRRYWLYFISPIGICSFKNRFFQEILIRFVKFSAICYNFGEIATMFFDIDILKFSTSIDLLLMIFFLSSVSKLLVFFEFVFIISYDTSIVLAFYFFNIAVQPNLLGLTFATKLYLYPILSFGPLSFRSFWMVRKNISYKNLKNFCHLKHIEMVDIISIVTRTP